LAEPKYWARPSWSSVNPQSRATAHDGHGSFWLPVARFPKASLLVKGEVSRWLAGPEVVQPQSLYSPARRGSAIFISSMSESSGLKRNKGNGDVFA
jgi:hypothetical protein